MEAAHNLMGEILLFSLLASIVCCAGIVLLGGRRKHSIEYRRRTNRRMLARADRRRPADPSEIHSR